MVLLPLFIFILGLIIGSFLNVVILRMNTGRSIAKGRSKCARCNKTLHWHELIPVFSFLAQRGKCRGCRVPISFQYPVVELLTAVVFTVLYTNVVIPMHVSTLSFVIFLFDALVASILIVITIYDARHKIIPDNMVYGFILLSVVAMVWKVFTISGFNFWAALVSGVVVALPFFLIWAISHGRAMGFGDVKLALGIGWFLGLSAGFMAVVLAFWIGAVVGLGILAVSHRHSMRSEIPFGPFLILGFAIVGLWSLSIQTLFPLWF